MAGTYIPTGTRGRLHLVPDVASDTFCLIAATQTLTDKTLSGATSFTGAVSLVGATGGAVTAGLLAGGGTSATKAATATADKNFLEFYTSSTATSGDSRGLYLRHFVSGTGGSGEAIRAVGIVNNKTVATGGTVNGAHISLELDGASAAISGQANVERLTFMASATPTAFGGTCAVQTLETNLPSSATVPATMAFQRIVNLDSVRPNYLWSIEAPSSTMVATAGTGANSCALSGGGVAAKAIKIKVDGTDYWLPLFSSNS